MLCIAVAGRSTDSYISCSSKIFDSEDSENSLCILPTAVFDRCACIPMSAALLAVSANLIYW